MSNPSIQKSAVSSREVTGGRYAAQLPIIPLGMSLGLFFALSFVLCVLFGLLISDQGMHQLLPMVLPGFAWLSWPSFFLGLIETFAYGWYVALIFGPLFNLCVARLG